MSIHIISLVAKPSYREDFDCFTAYFEHKFTHVLYIALFILALKMVSNRFTFKPVWLNHIHYVVYRKQFPKHIRGIYIAALNRINFFMICLLFALLLTPLYLGCLEYLSLGSSWLTGGMSRPKRSYQTIPDQLPDWIFWSLQWECKHYCMHSWEV